MSPYQSDTEHFQAKFLFQSEIQENWRGPDLSIMLTESCKFSVVRQSLLPVLFWASAEICTQYSSATVCKIFYLLAMFNWLLAQGGKPLFFGNFSLKWQNIRHLDSSILICLLQSALKDNSRSDWLKLHPTVQYHFSLFNITFHRTISFLIIQYVFPMPNINKNGLPMDQWDSSIHSSQIIIRFVNKDPQP